MPLLKKPRSSSCAAASELLLASMASWPPRRRWRNGGAAVGERTPSTLHNTQDRVNALKLPYQLLPDAARSLQACGLRFLTDTVDLAEDQEVSSIAQADHPLLTGANDSDHEHAPSPTDVFAAEPYERSPKKKQRVA